MRLILFFLLVLFSSAPLYPAPLKLVTGEYAPYSGEKLPAGGIATRIVKAAFAEVHQDVVIEFTPWTRAMNYAVSGKFAGSFPWAISSERKKDFLYSDTIHNFRILTYIKKDSELDKKFDIQAKKICIPSGWDISFILNKIKDKKVLLERPINMESCFQMLAMGRVDFIVINEQVGVGIIKKLFPQKNSFKAVESAYFGNNTSLHFIVSRKLPHGKKVMAEFNRGLKLIRKNGKYEKIVKDLR